MKTPLKKGSFRNFFINYGYLFLIVPFVSYLLWYYPLNAINEVRNDEQINFFITGYTFNDDSLENDIHSLLKNDGCYEVNIHFYSPKDNYLVSYYERFGEESDFIFLYESDLNEMFKDALEGVTSSFLPWSNKIKEDAKCMENDVFYNVNGLDYAFEIYNPNGSRLSQIENFVSFEDNEPVYMLLNSRTPNWGDYLSSSLTQNAKKCLPFFIERYR